MAGENRATNTSQVTRLVYSALKQKGYAGRIVSISHLDDLKEEFEHHRNQGVLDEALYQLDVLPRNLNVLIKLGSS